MAGAAIRAGEWRTGWMRCVTGGGTGWAVIALAAALVLTPVSVPAQTLSPESPSSQVVDPSVQALARDVQIEQVIAVMRDEGLESARTLRADMFPDAGERRWVAEAEEIYDATQMQDDFLQAFSAALSGNPDVGAMRDFIGGEFGQRVVGLELAARKALLDPAVEDAASVAWLQLQDDDSARVRQIERFVTVNDLMDSNVTGAMNANLAFYRGLMLAAPADAAMTEEDMLAAVAATQDQIAMETEDWLYPYLTLAYQPLGDDEMERYLEFCASDAGRALNRALFAAFAAMFDRISLDLGKAAGRRMQGSDI